MTVQIMPNEVSARLKRTLGRKDEAKAEILEWIGTAYGRRREAKPEHLSAVSQAAAAHQPIAPLDWIARAMKLIDYKRWASAVSRYFKSGTLKFRNLTLCVSLLACATAAAAIVLFQGSTLDATTSATTDLVPQATGTAPTPPSEQFASVEQIVTTGAPAAARAPAMAPTVIEERPASLDLEAAAGAANEAKAQLSSERNARVEAEAQTARLVTEAATLKLAREKAETTLASMGSELEAARTARRDAEAAARAASGALIRKEQQMALAAAPAVMPPKPDAPAVSESRILPARLNKASTSSSAGNAAFLAGRKLAERGDMPAARLQFEKAVKAGLPEAALALGNTYDPVSLTRAGSARAGDPELARQWYRRAYALALRQQHR